ncbi:MAG: radical SAM family heme chaperone HemW, partial [Cyanobacteriota bacterium]|nr:radical SAM family heme chaperone HemW [Cyanobacteriota bacterium]
MVNSPIALIARSAYLHIPFCRRRCYYCDFAVAVVGDRRRGENSTWIQQYVEVLCEEITQVTATDQPLETIFFGGGTPSLLSVPQLSQILDTLDRCFGIESQAEISMEMDPDTFDRDQLQGFVNLGINRVSLGVQAFDDQLLQACGRSHTVADIYKAVDLLHTVGVSNYSLDLISGLPHQTIELWQQSLQAVIKINPPHLSHYDLIVEPKTVFGRYYSPGVSPLPTDETTAAMYRLAQKMLTQAGYTHYEVSNYAQPGYECRHNLVYWRCLPYYGFGMGAASY